LSLLKGNLFFGFSEKKSCCTAGKEEKLFVGENGRNNVWVIREGNCKSSLPENLIGSK
jgi:hypothetical protein